MEPSSEHEPRKAYPPEKAEYFKKFTPQEQRVVELTEQNLGRQEIAAELGIDERTVDYHLYNAGNKVPGPGTPAEKVHGVYAVWCGASTQGKHLKPPYRT